MVRAYSSQTGEWVRDLRGASSEIINLQTDHTNHKLVYACTVDGQVISWKWRSGAVNESTTLQFATGGGNVHTFHKLDLGEKHPYGLVSWSARQGCQLKCSVFDLADGADTKFFVGLT